MPQECVKRTVMRGMQSVVLKKVWTKYAFEPYDMVQVLAVSFVLFVFCSVWLASSIPSDQSSNSTIHYECLYAVGGGVPSPSGGFPQARIKQNPDCLSAFNLYFAQVSFFG